MPLPGATLVWSGAAGPLWSNPANWGGAAPVAGDDLVFPPGALNPTNTNDLPAGTAFRSLTFSGGGYSVNGNQILLAASGLSSAVGPVTLGLPVRLAASQTWTITAGTLQIDGAVDLNASTLTLSTQFGSGAQAIITGAVTGGGALVQNLGILTLSGTAVAAPITSRNGRLNLTSNMTTGALTLDGAALQISPNVSAGTGSFRVGGVSEIFVATAAATDTPGALRVTGTVDLTNTELGVILANPGAIAPGTTYTIIDNDGADAVIGNFVGLPNHSILPSVGSPTRRVMVSYDGGTGNDVVLTVLDAGIPTTTTVICAPDPAFVRTVVTCTATVTSGAGTPDGLVSFFGFPSQLGTVPISDPAFATFPLDATGHAAISYSGFSAGLQSALAIYHGSTKFAFSSGGSNNFSIIVPVPALDPRALIALGLVFAALALTAMRR